VRQLARIVAEPHDEELVVARIEGEVDMSNAPAIATRLRELLTNRSLALVIDLGATTYLDSSGIALLFALGDELRRRQQQLLLVVPNASQLVRAIRITGLDRALPMHETVDQAVADAR
jgi:anti-anti-sigma factor